MPQTTQCKSIGCGNRIEVVLGQDFCTSCQNRELGEQRLSARYPNNYKSVGDLSEVDAFAINQMFMVQDPSGCMQHAITKLLHASSSPSTYADIREARDTLTRWLQLNQERSPA